MTAEVIPDRAVLSLTYQTLQVLLTPLTLPLIRPYHWKDLEPQIPMRLCGYPATHNDLQYKGVTIVYPFDTMVKLIMPSL